MELIKYILAVAVGAFVAGVGAITFIDGKIDLKLKPHVEKIDANTLHLNSAVTFVDSRIDTKLDSYITKAQADAAYVKEPFSERVIELQRVIDTPGST